MHEAIELSADTVGNAARAAARRELRVVKEAIAHGTRLPDLWFEVYLPHHLYLRQFLSAGHCETLRYVSDRFAGLCARGMPSDETFIDEASRGIRASLLENQ